METYHTVESELEAYTLQELIKLLPMYGIKKSDIVGHGKNGGLLKSDVISAILEVIKSEESTQVFSGIRDIDEQILDALDTKSLYNACHLNQYAFNVCQQSSVLRKRMRDYIGQNLTHIPEIDEKILEELDNKSLYNVCQVNNYVFDLCQHSPILKPRVLNYIKSQAPIINPHTGRAIRRGGAVARRYGL